MADRDGDLAMDLSGDLWKVGAEAFRFDDLPLRSAFRALVCLGYTPRGRDPEYWIDAGKYRFVAVHGLGLCVRFYKRRGWVPYLVPVSVDDAVGLAGGRLSLRYRNNRAVVVDLLAKHW